MHFNVNAISDVNSSRTKQSLNFSRPVANNSSANQNGFPAPQSENQSIWSRPIWEPPPVGTKMPSSKEFQLTKAMVGVRAKDNVIIVTFGNYAFMDFVLNWVKHLTDLGVFNLLVGIFLLSVTAFGLHA